MGAHSIPTRGNPCACHPPLPIGLTLGIATGVLALAPAAQAATVSAAAGEPTYTCQTDTPGNTGVPISIRGIGCQASNGAPTTGVSGPVKLVINQPRYHPHVPAWTCHQARALGLANAMEVIAMDCRP
ncbi:hypothetical protein [Actinomadura alba]|uniref:Secreted protein n=1 Tax=Actinomadura alba TaxID=406431 RepID=A0ABR7M2E1_9ACTN|nr:hypothetical protein [Actinomadura alba]MBC6471206.1 hypothetical protein [Actinomadura alba]